MPVRHVQQPGDVLPHYANLSAIAVTGPARYSDIAHARQPSFNARVGKLTLANPMSVKPMSVNPMSVEPTPVEPMPPERLARPPARSSATRRRAN